MFAEYYAPLARRERIVFVAPECGEKRALEQEEIDQVIFKNYHDGCLLRRDPQKHELQHTEEDQSLALDQTISDESQVVDIAESRNVAHEVKIKARVISIGDTKGRIEELRNSPAIHLNKSDKLYCGSSRVAFQYWLILLLASLTYLQHAKTCLCFGYPQHNHNSGVSLFNNPNQPLWNFAYQRLHLTTSQPVSFSGDQDSSSQENLNSWTSMLTNSLVGQQDKLDQHIKKILVPRVSGTPGNEQVRQYIVDTLESNGFHTELDEFTDDTPYGKVNFANIIASSNPNACRQLVFACHHDSKMMDGFLGATDSAVPCAMLLKMSETFSKSFRAKDGEDVKDSLGLTFIFFDGEEAFVEWGPTDSLYGSRHLAEKWHNQPAPAYCNKPNELARIEMMVLLDLIGTSTTSFVMYNRQLKHHYEAMQNFERAHLARRGLSSTQIKRESAFKNGYIPLDFIQDDHVPFQKRGVPILSLLAHPFPKVWHTVNDNYSAIDLNRTKRIQQVLEEFIANYKKAV